MNENKQIHHHMAKIRERIAMILDYHIPNGKPIIESDKEFIHCLCRVWYNGEIESITKEPLHKPEPKQGGLFKGKNGNELFPKHDSKSGKADGTDIDTK